MALRGMPSCCAHLTQVSDAVLEQVVEESRAERVRLQQDAALG